MKALILALALTASSILTFAAPAKAYVCYSPQQYQTWGAACN